MAGLFIRFYLPIGSWINYDYLPETWRTLLVWFSPDHKKSFPMSENVRPSSCWSSYAYAEKYRGCVIGRG